MALSSYDELLKQVASLKSENCHLRRELQDNSSHLTKLENDASNMKDVLSHIQITFAEQELDEHDFGDVQGDCGKETGAEDYNEEDPALASHTSLCDDSFEDDVYQGQAAAVDLDEGETSMTESSGSQAADVYSLFQKLDTERKQLMLELERDEQHRFWFYNQLKTITQKMEGLQHSEKYSVQTDSARCQLEMEAHKVLGAMQEKLGSGEQSKLRQEARLGRIRNIETEIRSLPMPAKQALKEVKDAATSTLLARDVFKIKPDQEEGVGGFASDRTSARSGQSATLATQTGEVTLMEVPDGVAPGIPLSSNMMAMYHGAWPIDKAMTGSSGAYSTPPVSQDLASVISFNSTNTNSSGSLGAPPGNSQPVSVASSTGEPSQQFGTKVEMVYSLLSMLGTHDKDDMSRTLFAMSQSQDSCIAMRQSGCLPLLLQLLHGSERDSGLLGKTRGSKAARARAAAALHNIVHCNHDDKRGRREARTLRLLEQIRAHCDQQRGESDDEDEEAVVSSYSDMDHHPGAAIAALMKLSFDEDYRHAICTLGGLQAIAELLQVDNRINTPLNEYSTTIRRYSCMALTNLTFGDGKNKALLCSMHSAMEALTDQLRSSNEDLVQAAASVLRNLSWRADLASKKTLREIGAVSTLTRAAMTVKKETTLKSILSALWNLSSHCSENKAEICAVEGALQFLVSLLTYKSTAKTLAIIENGGGILRNVSSQVAIREDYRQILRKHDCLKILLHHLRSPSLTIVSNACGTLWNLSARCEEDQNALRDMGAVSMLRNLIHSRHKMISSGSSAALRNLLSSVPEGKSVDNDKSMEPPRPSLHVRKLRALEAELDDNLSETCENVESPRSSPTEIVHRSESEPRRFVYHLNGGGGGDGGHLKEEDNRQHMTRRQMMQRNCSENSNSRVPSSPGQVVRTGSQDSVGSTHSDISHDRTRAHTMLAKSSLLLHKRQGSSLDRKDQQAAVHNGTPRPNNSHGVLKDHKVHNCGNIVNNTPAHVRQHHHSNFQHQNPPQHQNSHGWQTMPNSRIVKYMHEVAMYAGVEPAGNFHGHSSLTQSAPAHSQPFHYPIFTNNHSLPHPLLERLAKPSSSLSSSCNLNTTMGNSASSDYSNQRSMSSAVDEETDQPVNYSLKYQDGSGGDKNNKSSSIGNIHMSYNHLTSASGSLNLRSAAMPEHMRSRVINEHGYLLNNSGVHDKITPNQSVANTLLNPAILAPHRPVPNLVHNRFHTPQGYQSAGPSHHPQFMTPQKSFTAPAFHPRGFIYSSTRPTQNTHPSLPSNVSNAPGYSPQGTSFSTSTKQFNKVKTAHQNQPHLRPIKQFSAYAETDLDLVVDQPTDFSLRYNEVSEETCSDGYQEQPINYSMRFCDSGGREGQQLGPYMEDSHCVECKYAEARRTNERIEISSNDDQVRTFCTEGTPYLSTATSLTDLTQAGKHDREDEEDGQDVATDNNNKMSADLERGGSRSDINAAASSSVSQGTERHTCSTVVGSTRGQEFMSSNVSSQMSDQHRVQQSFHADSNEGALDQTKTYCEEGTPLCFSRVSSLSSLHCTEPRENSGLSSSSTEKAELACIDEADTPEAMVISVIENKEAVCSSSKSTSSIKRATTDQVLKGDKEAKTVTFDENNQIEETPLMFSRCSSPESLSSFDTQSVHSSVISEYSRRASEVVSPSEIPDSPSESMPPSPRQTHSPSRRFKDFPSTPKSMNIISKQPLDFDKTPSTVKAEPFGNLSGFDEEDKPINFAMRNPEIPILHTFSAFDDDQPIDFSSVHREEEQQHLAFSTFQKNSQSVSANSNSHLANKLLTPRTKTIPAVVEQNAETESSSGKSEVPVIYAEEGTPPNFSETSSLSGITMASSSTRGGGAKHSHSQYQPHEQDLPKFDMNEPRSEVVQKIEAPFISCVIKENTPGKVWSPVKEHLKHEDRDSSMSDVSEGEEDILAQCISSGMPTPVASARKMRRSSSDNTVKRKSGIPMKTVPDARPQNSSNLSPVPKSLPKKLPFSNKSPSDTARSDNSSVENEDLLLSQMIESGMPKSKGGRKFAGGADHSGGNGDGGKQSSRDSNTSAFIPRTSTITVVAPFHDFIPTDTVRTYNVEDTPRNFSNATSLSDLTIDSDGSKSGCAGLIRSPKAGKGFNDIQMDSKQSPSKLRMPTHLGNKSPAKGRSNARQIPRDDKRGCSGLPVNEEPEYITFSPPSNDTLHNYGVEGTPVTFSRNDSLSSLCGGKDSRGTGSGISASPRKDNRFDKDESDSSCSLPKERHVIGQSSEDSSVAGDRGDRPIKFAVEDTPVCFSRNSSLSSLNSLEQPESAPSTRRDYKEPTMSQGKTVKSETEHSDSCDSLSDELADCDPTPSEQALLDQCINSAMPKSRFPKRDDRGQRHTKAKFLCQKVGVARSSNTATPGTGLTKCTSLEIPAGIINGYHNGSDVDQGSQGSLSQNQSSSENLMTRSCSDTTELDLSFQNPPSSSRKSRYSNWHRQRHWSQDGGENGVNEVCAKNNDSSIGAISPEETEQLVADNVKLVMSDLQTTNMTSSTVEEDFFIDNETISLVSNDYASDTNSDISFTMSGASDRNSERSSVNLSESQNHVSSSVRAGGPKFFKPGSSQCPVKKATNEDAEVKVVKGRRKPLYPKTSSAGIVAKGNVKAVNSPGNRGVTNLVGNRGAPLTGVGKSSTGLKKTPPKNSSVAQISPKSVASEGGSSKNGSPPQKNADQRSRSSGSSTPPGISGASSPSGDKIVPKAAASHANRPNLVKFSGKTATAIASKSNINAGTNFPTGQLSLPADSSTSPHQSSLLTNSAKSPGLSRLPTASSSNKASSNSAVNSSNKSNKSGIHTSSLTASSTANDKKLGQITLKHPVDVLSNGTASNKGSGSCIPTRKSSGSSPVLNSPDPTKQLHSGSIDPNKCTPPGSVVKKHTPSKIATLKRRDDSLDSSSLRDSPVSSTSSSSSRLPISIMKTSPASPKPSSLPPSGVKSKASTLPNSSLTSSKSRSVGDRISKSSTYEKISSELQDHGIISDIGGLNVLKNAELDNSLKQNYGSFDSPESGVRRGEIFELCDEYDNCEPCVARTIHHGINGQSNLSFDHNEHLENNVFEDSLSNHQENVKLFQNSTSSSLDSFERNIHIDSSTFRKKKPGASTLEFELPNADETCRSMCSFNDSFGSPQTNNCITSNHKDSFCDDNIISEISIAESSNHERSELKIDNKTKHGEEKAGGKGKSIVAQGLKKLFSGRHKDKEKGTKVQISEKDSNKSKHQEKETKTKHSKSKSKDKKNGKDKKETDFFQSNIKIEPALTVDEKLLTNQGTSCVVSANQVPRKGEIASSDGDAATTTRNSSSNHVVFSSSGDQTSEISEEGCLALPSEKHMTKTEMLLARRRRTNLSSSLSDGGRSEKEVVAGCMVTTV